MAIVVTATMDATGLSAFSALPLLPITAGLWYAQRLSRTEVGFCLGRPHHYALALLHPLAVIGLITGIAFALGAARIDAVPWKRAGVNILVNATAGILAVLFTEEGFFRGWLWASLKRAGLSENRTLLGTSVAFAAWHISAVAFDTGFRPEPDKVPILLTNALVLGLIWGLMRMMSGSAVVPSVCHSLWNAVAYSLYGFGTKGGALGVHETAVLAPEVGILGLVLNAIFAAMLFLAARRRQLRSGSEKPGRGAPEEIPL